MCMGRRVSLIKIRAWDIEMGDGGESKENSLTKTLLLLNMQEKTLVFRIAGSLMFSLHKPNDCHALFRLSVLKDFSFCVCLQCFIATTTFFKCCIHSKNYARFFFFRFVAILIYVNESFFVHTNVPYPKAGMTFSWHFTSFHHTKRILLFLFMWRYYSCNERDTIQRCHFFVMMMTLQSSPSHSHSQKLFRCNYYEVWRKFACINASVRHTRIIGHFKWFLKRCQSANCEHGNE